MAKYERHPAPEKLLRQITTEAVNLLALGGPENIKAAELPADSVSLIAEAWGLPQRDLDTSIGLIEKQKELTNAGASEGALPDGEMWEQYDGGMVAELLWGLFETAIRLEDGQDRFTVYQLALMLADTLDFDEWIEESGPAADG